MAKKNEKESDKRPNSKKETEDQMIKAFVERSKKYREKYGILKHRGILGKLTKLMR